MNNAADLNDSAADLNDSAADLAAIVLRDRTLAAIEVANRCAQLLALAPASLPALSGSTRTDAERQAEEDAWATRQAIGEARRLLADCDPLGALDDEAPARRDLTEARDAFHTACAQLVELGIDLFERNSERAA